MVLFSIIWWFTSRPRPRFAPSALFLILYGTARSFIELVRVPDEHIGYLAGGWVTEGQVLSFPMIIGGLALLAYAYRARAPSGNFVTAQ
jgi:phosphatidylglycerol:prolipoprotein diacylglycerol transferase